MQFGKTLRNKLIKEWRYYAVDYKALKKIIGAKQVFGLEETTIDEAEFNRVIDESLDRISKFYFDKESWAQDYVHVLEERLDLLRESYAKSCALPQESSPDTSDDAASMSSVSSSDDDDSDQEGTNKSPTGATELDNDHPIGKLMKSSKITSSGSLKKKKKLLKKNNFLKNEYRAVGKSEHFQRFIYAKKAMATFDRELSLILEFLDLNTTAFSKILKKFDKVSGLVTRDRKMEEILSTYSHLNGEVIATLKDHVESMMDEVQQLKPLLPEGWENRKVYTIGCFDLFHRGHQNVLMSLREFGYFVVAGIHDDESYFKLKNKYTIDNLETRMNNVKPFVDQLYVIPSTDPLLYIQSMVSTQDIEAGSCCYARGDDMLQFPGREWVESVMPVHFVPRTESCSSTLIRTIYHADDKELQHKAAFAKTRYDGKPIDDKGNVLTLSKSCPVLS